MLRALKKHYDECGISAINFNCKHYKECRSTSQDKSKFTTAREAYVGQYYGKRGLPKLLFLSLDPGNSDGRGNKIEDRESRTIRGMRKGNLRLSPQDMPKQRHWYKTHQFAWVIIDEIKKLSKLGIDIGKTNRKLFFEPESEIYKIMPYFAHTNSAKCCMNNDQAKQANRLLFDNCREYIPKEIQIFDPHILVTQGQSAQQLIEDAIKIEIFSMKKERNVSMANSRKPDFRIIEVNINRPLLWIHHYHPSNYGVFNTKIYPKYRTYAKNAARFISKYYPELLG